MKIAYVTDSGTGKSIAEMAKDGIISVPGSLGVVKNIEFKIVAYLPRFFMLVFVKFYASIYRILLYSVL